VPGPAPSQDPSEETSDQRDASDQQEASDQRDADAFDVQLDTTIYQAALGTQVTYVAPSLLDFLR
jgi:hypothetical protein